MPLPRPQKDETRNKFISRCMSDPKSKKEFTNSPQRLAMCLSKAAAASTDILENTDLTYYIEKYGYTEELNIDTFVFVESNDYLDAGDESEEIDISVAKPGLWENIRKKKEREGKKYRPAKPGDPDRPSPEEIKKAQSDKEYKYKDPKTGEIYTYQRPGAYKKDGRYLIKAAEYQGKKVTLNKPFRTSDGPKKFSVYVKNEKDNIVKVNFGDPNMDIKRDDPKRRKSFRARHQCDTNPGPKWKARYWSCKFWESNKSVKDLLK
jgi:hypothetical protein